MDLGGSCGLIDVIEPFVLLVHLLELVHHDFESLVSQYIADTLFLRLGNTRKVEEVAEVAEHWSPLLPELEGSGSVPSQAEIVLGRWRTGVASGALDVGGGNLFATAEGSFQLVVKLPLVQRSPVSPDLGDFPLSLRIVLSRRTSLSGTLTGLVCSLQESPIVTHMCLCAFFVFWNFRSISSER